MVPLSLTPAGFLHNTTLLALRPAEQAIIRALLQSRGNVVRRSDFPNLFGRPQPHLHHYVYWLRVGLQDLLHPAIEPSFALKALSDSSWACIESLASLGYRWVGPPVEIVPTTPKFTSVLPRYTLTVFNHPVFLDQVAGQEGLEAYRPPRPLLKWD